MMIRLFNTVKYLKFIQIYFRLYYFIRGKYRKLIRFQYQFTKDADVQKYLNLNLSVVNKYSVYENNKFSFLNLTKKFEDNIDWNYFEYGKLWTYNLTYFEYLKDKEDVMLIHDFINNIENIEDGLEPFPISLRGINWIKFISKYNIQDEIIDASLYAQYYILLDNIEYHLLGNHLLENGFSLLFGAYYFEDEKLYNKAIAILKDELEEQVLTDGGHFELSPMYHQIMLFRLLDCINLLQNNSWKENRSILDFLTIKAEAMLAWLNNISYQNGDIPLLNDSTNSIAPTSNEIFQYANRLNLKPQSLKLQDSGYRKIIQKKYECVVDIGEVGASYIPGHAHADTFNFELRINRSLSTIPKPFIVDSGLSSYEAGDIRSYERSTKAHNTVEVLAKNSSDVWGVFRVANRASIIALEEKDDYIGATHDGYKQSGIYHTREWNFQEDKIVIVDRLNKNVDAIARLHFHPDVLEDEIRKKVKPNTAHYALNTYQFASEFNKQEKAKVMEIPFNGELIIEITL